jgi:hypothetical protein
MRLSTPAPSRGPTDFRLARIAVIRRRRALLATLLVALATSSCGGGAASTSTSADRAAAAARTSQRATARAAPAHPATLVYRSRYQPAAPLKDPAFAGLGAARFALLGGLDSA